MTEAFEYVGESNIASLGGSRYAQQSCSCLHLLTVEFPMRSFETTLHRLNENAVEIDDRSERLCSALSSASPGGHYITCTRRK